MTLADFCPKQKDFVTLFQKKKKKKNWVKKIKNKKINK